MFEKIETDQAGVLILKPKIFATSGAFSQRHIMRASLKIWV